ANDLLVLTRADDGDEGHVLLEVHVAEALGFLIGKRADAPKKAHMNVLRRHAVEHDLHALCVASARWPKHDLASGFELNDPFLLDEVALAATQPVGGRHERLALGLIEKTLAEVRMRNLD